MSETSLFSISDLGCVWRHRSSCLSSEYWAIFCAKQGIFFPRTKSRFFFMYSFSYVSHFIIFLHSYISPPTNDHLYDWLNVDNHHFWNFRPLNILSVKYFLKIFFFKILANKIYSLEKNVQVCFHTLPAKNNSSLLVLKYSGPCSGLVG